MKAAVTILVFCVAALLALGMVMLYSSSMVQVGAHYLVKQLVWGAFGVVCCVFAAALDYRWLRKFALPLFAFSVILLALVLSPQLGTRAGGARRWFDFGGVRFQPSELAKIALIIGMAWYVDLNQRHMRSWIRGIIVPCVGLGLMIGLVFSEPDRGTSILMAAVGGTMLLIGGVRLIYIFPPAVAAASLLAFSLWNDPMRMKRIFSWLYLEENREGVGYQAYQSMVALGAGGISGLGLGNGRQKLGFVPQHHTDFIFSVIGEELGLVATLFVLAAFVAIVICGIVIARRASDVFGTLIVSGITFLIGFQAFINIGVVTSALPNKGLSLPFISYGGSSLLAMLTCVGLILSVARRAHVDDAEEQEKQQEIKVAQLQ